MGAGAKGAALESREDGVKADPLPGHAGMRALPSSCCAAEGGVAGIGVLWAGPGVAACVLNGVSAPGAMLRVDSKLGAPAALASGADLNSTHKVLFDDVVRCVFLSDPAQPLPWPASIDEAPHNEVHEAHASYRQSAQRLVQNVFADRQRMTCSMLATMATTSFAWLGSLVLKIF